MRVIFNIHSNRAAHAAGWRARAVQVNDKADAFLYEALKATAMAGGTSIYDYITEEDHLSSDWALVVNGITIPDKSSFKLRIKDNTQIHLLNS
jgi:hypothetical protein